jgi:hypothetical protein
VAWAQRLQRHFLLARAREVQAVKTQSPESLRGQLREARATYMAIGTTERAGLGLAVDHLEEWATAIA